MSKLSDHRLVKRVFKLVDNPIAISVAFALWAIPFQFWLNTNVSEEILEDYDTLQHFIEWFGVPYGVLIALVLVYVWTQFDALNIDFDREADAISSLYGTILLVVNPSLADIRNDIIEYLRKYIQHTLQNYNVEWRGESSLTRNEGDNLLDKLRSSIGALIHTEEKDLITGGLLSLANDIVDIRGDRLSRSKQRILFPVRILSIVSSILWLIPFIALNYKNFYLGMVLTGGVTFVVISLLLIITDLDQPFTGTWYIKNDSWTELDEKIK